jgi:hypothetical protein
MERKKLELQINSPVNLQLLFDEPLVGESKFGEYYMYAVKNGNDDAEYSFFAPVKVHEQLKGKSKKGTAFTITKTATQKGKKLVTDFEVKFLDNGKEEKQAAKSNGNYYFEEMKKSFEDSTNLQKIFNGLNLNTVAISLFISRTKQSNGHTIKELVQ